MTPSVATTPGTGRGEDAKRLVCGRAGCGTCCACGAHPPAGEPRLLAFPVRGLKQWLCPACLASVLDAARRAPSS